MQRVSMHKVQTVEFAAYIVAWLGLQILTKRHREKRICLETKAKRDNKKQEERNPPKVAFSTSRNYQAIDGSDVIISLLGVKICA
jgi:hypothetical protein